MLIPRLWPVSSRIFCLQHRSAFGAMRSFGCRTLLMLKPRNLRSAVSATPLFESLTFSLSRLVMKRVTPTINCRPAPPLRT